MKPTRPRRRVAALCAALAIVAVGATGCGEGLKRAVDTARSLQQQGKQAASQAEQQVQSVENQFQQQQGSQQGQGGGSNYGY